MIQLHPPHGFGQTGWLSGVERLRLFLKVNVAVGAGAGAGWPHDQKRGGAGLKTFADIGAGCFFADCVQAEVAQNFFDRADSFPLRALSPAAILV